MTERPDISSTSCRKYPIVILLGTDTSPSSGVSSPTIMRNSVVFPDPFGPTRPTFSPGLSWKDASTNRICLPYCLLTFENEIIRRSSLFLQRGRPVQHHHERLGRRIDDLAHEESSSVARRLVSVRSSAAAAADVEQRNRGAC